MYDDPRLLHGAAGTPDTATVLSDLGLSATDVIGIVRAASALLGHIATQDLHALPSALLTELPVAVEQHSRVVEAARARALSAVEADGTWALNPQRSVRGWYAETAGLTPAQAGRHIARSRVLREHLPGFGAELAAGRVPVAAVDALAATLKGSPARTEALADEVAGESFLADAATRLSAGDFRTLTAQWAATVDPEAQERAWRESIERQEVTLAATLGGWHLAGWLAHETGLVLKTAMDAVIGRPAAEDSRSRAQHNAAALETLARRLLDSGSARSGARIRPHLMVHVPVSTAELVAQAITSADAQAGTADVDMAAFAEDFLRHRRGGPAEGSPSPAGASATDESATVIPGDLDVLASAGAQPATFSDGTVLAPGQLSRHLCDGVFTRTIFSGAGEPLDVGSAKRLFTAAQVKALIGRDRHCQFRGCGAPPDWCEAHHALAWNVSKRTDTPNGVLLCWTHHQEVHRHHLTITRHPDRWEFRYPGGDLHSCVARGLAHPAQQLGLWTTP